MGSLGGQHGSMGIVLLALGCTGQRTEQGGAPTQSRTAPSAIASVPVFAAPPATATVLAAAAPAPTGATEPRCREQPAQEFLLRDGQIAKIGAPLAERRAIEAARKRSIDYRTRHYGRFPGVGSSADNPHPPRFYAKLTKFMGLPILLNKKILPAVACVEAALVRECSDHPYRPRAVGGIRLDNTFKDYE